MTKAEYYISKLELIQHPEGGYFKEVYRSDESLEENSLPIRYGSSRNFSTSIYFLLNGNQFSSFHKLKSDEIWHHYDGCSITIYLIDASGKLELKVLGKDLEKEQSFQITIPKGSWFAAKPDDENSFSLIGCTVAPGFEFNDFELGKREELISLFPLYRKLIVDFTNE
ncbi:MAG: cupin domain-containing protein [Ignavibacteriaceae bacterium]|nr:cupin domain-containing protein [Ignavibacteriaceae bacterium]